MTTSSMEGRPRPFFDVEPAGLSQYMEGPDALPTEQAPGTTFQAGPGRGGSLCRRGRDCACRWRRPARARCAGPHPPARPDPPRLPALPLRPEAAAWGFNVAEARAGRYPGLRPDEFREALDRQGEHYAALKALMKEKDPGRWSGMADLLRQPELLIKTGGSPLAAGRWHPSGWGRSPAIP